MTLRGRKGSHRGLLMEAGILPQPNPRSRPRTRERAYRAKPALHFHECELCALAHRWWHHKQNCRLTLSAACPHYLLRESR
jgi:hypothetical protein